MVGHTPMPRRVVANFRDDKKRPCRSIYTFSDKFQDRRCLWRRQQQHKRRSRLKFEDDSFFLVSGFAAQPRSRIILKRGCEVDDEKLRDFVISYLENEDCEDIDIEVVVGED